MIWPCLIIGEIIEYGEVAFVLRVFRLFFVVVVYVVVVV